MHEKQKKELEAKVSSLQAEVRNAKSTRLKDGKGKESELKVLKAQEQSLKSQVTELEQTVESGKKEILELKAKLDGELKVRQESIEEVKKKGEYVREQLEF